MSDRPTTDEFPDGFVWSEEEGRPVFRPTTETPAERDVEKIREFLVAHHAEEGACRMPHPCSCSALPALDRLASYAAASDARLAAARSAAETPRYEDAICVKTGLHPVSCTQCLSCDVVHLVRKSCARCGIVYRGVVTGCRQEACPEVAALAEVIGRMGHSEHLPVLPGPGYNPRVTCPKCGASVMQFTIGAHMIGHEHEGEDWDA